MQGRRAELERRKGELNARRDFDLDTSGIDKELETINKELIVMDVSSATKVDAIVAKPKDGQVKLESKGQEDNGKSESKGKAEIKGSLGITGELSEDLSGTYNLSSSKKHQRYFIESLNIWEH